MSEDNDQPEGRTMLSRGFNRVRDYISDRYGRGAGSGRQRLANIFDDAALLYGGSRVGLGGLAARADLNRNNQSLSNSIDQRPLNLRMSPTTRLDPAQPNTTPSPFQGGGQGRGSSGGNRSQIGTGVNVGNLPMDRSPIGRPLAPNSGQPSPAITEQNRQANNREIRRNMMSGQMHRFDPVAAAEDLRRRQWEQKVNGMQK